MHENKVNKCHTWQECRIEAINRSNEKTTEQKRNKNAVSQKDGVPAEYRQTRIRESASLLPGQPPLLPLEQRIPSLHLQSLALKLLFQIYLFLGNAKNKLEGLYFIRTVLNWLLFVAVEEEPSELIQITMLSDNT